jgi:hypothetical protein
MDLVVNGPIKRQTRSLRAQRIYEAFRVFRREYYANKALPIHQQQSLKFSPPKPTLECGIKDLFEFFDTFFATSEFAAGMKRCFQKTGTGLKEGGGGFEAFHEEFIEGHLQVVPSDTLHEAYLVFNQLHTEDPRIVDEESRDELLVDTIIEAFDGDYGGCECPVDDDFIQQVVQSEEQAMNLDAVDADEEEEDDDLDSTDDFVAEMIVDSSPQDEIPENDE